MSFAGNERWEHLAQTVESTDSTIVSAHQSREAKVVKLVENSPEQYRGILRERMSKVLAAEKGYVGLSNIDQESGDTLVEVPKNELYLPERNEKKVHEQIPLGNLPTLYQELERRIWDMLMKGEKNIIVSVDGLPGAGKTTMVDAAREIQTKIGNGLDSIVIGMDQFIQFERSLGDLRTYLASDPELFWNLLYSRGLMKETLSRIYHANGTPTKLDVPQMYIGGQVRPNTITIPKEPKLIIAEGVGMTRIVKDFLQENGGEGVTVFIRGKFEKNVKRAIGRDVSKKLRTAEQTIAIQTAQGPHLMERATAELMPLADIIVVPHLN